MACGKNPSARSESSPQARARRRGCLFLWLLSFGQAKESDRRPGTVDKTHTDVSRFSQQTTSQSGDLRGVALDAIAPAALGSIERLARRRGQRTQPRRRCELREPRNADADRRCVAKLGTLLAELLGDARAKALGERDNRVRIAVGDDRDKLLAADAPEQVARAK